MKNGYFFEMLGMKYIYAFFRNSYLYALFFLGKKHSIVNKIPLTPWMGSTNNGRLLLRNEYLIKNEIINIRVLENCLEESTDFDDFAIVRMHSFEWLKDLKNIGDNLSRGLCRRLIKHWIVHNQSWRYKFWLSKSWDPDIVACRLINWLSLYDFFGSSASEDFNTMLKSSILKQYKHLERLTFTIKDPHTYFKALKGLVFLAVAYDHRKKIDIFLHEINKVMHSILLKDGAHSSCCPALQYLFLRDIIDIKTALRSIGYEEPSFLHDVIVQGTPVLRFFRHGDGTLANFKGNVKKRELGFCPEKLESQMIDNVLSLADVSGRPPSKVENMGYKRLFNKTGLILVNEGVRSNSSGYTKLEPGLGILDFEWSYRSKRLIETADTFIQKNDKTWIRPSLENGNFMGNLKNRHGNLVFSGDFDDRIGKLTYRHQRQLFASSSGIDFRGQDTFTVSENSLIGIRFAFSKNIKVEEKIKNGQKKFLISLCGNLDKVDSVDKIPSWSLLYSDCDDIVYVDENNQNSASIIFLKRNDNFLPWAFKWFFRIEKNNLVE